MGKHINTKVKCFRCGKSFMTARLKEIGEIYDCPKCGKKHQMQDDTDGWIHWELEEDE